MPVGKRISTMQPRISAATPGLPSLQPVERITGRKLQERRARKRQENPLCVRCEERGVTRPWTQLDHKVPLWQGGADTDENTEGLCDPCHEAKTSEEARART